MQTLTEAITRVELESLEEGLIEAMQIIKGEIESTPFAELWEE